MSTIGRKCLHISSYKYHEKIERHTITNMFNSLYTFFFQHHSSSPILPGLELLSNELLLEILSYLPVSDLYYGWLNLNLRFNIVLHNLPIRKFYNKPEG
jgi:hypothetical protein